MLTTRGLLLLGAVALACLKIAGVLDWPWLTVAVPLVGWAFPYIIVIGGALGAICIAIALAALAAFAYVIAFAIELIGRLLPRRRLTLKPR